MNISSSPDPQNDYTSDPDVLLMLDAQKGHTVSFEALLRKYFTRVLNFAYRYLQSRENAEDIAQETFVRVYRALPSYRPASKFQTWLYTIARNLCLNEIKSHKNKNYSLDALTDRGDDETPAQFRDESSPGPAQEIEKKELMALVVAAVNSLPENQKTAVLLQRFEGLAYEQIADIMGCSTQAVKSLLNRAKENLKDKLSGMPD